MAVSILLPSEKRISSIRRIHFIAAFFLSCWAIFSFTPAMAKDTLNVALQMEPPALDTTSGASSVIDDVSYGSIFEGLVRFSANGQIEGWLAKNWTISKDGKEYLFNLRQKVTFSDGQPFNAATAAYSLNRARDIHSGNVQQEALSIIDKIETPSPFQLRITLKEANSFFLTLLSLPDCAMISPVSAKNLATLPVGTGAFRFQEWQHGKKIQLVARSDYWGKKPAIKTLNFFFLSDALAAYAAAKTGQIDFFPDFPAAENLQELAHDPRLTVKSFPSEGEVILAFNQHLPLFHNLLLRQAISLAINRPAFVDAVLYGYGRIIGSHFPPQNTDYLDLTSVYSYNPERAKALLKQAGYPNGLSLVVDLPPSRYAIISGQLVADQLEKIGIHVTIHALEWTSWLDRVYKKHDFQMTIVNHAEPFDYRIYDKEGYYFGYHNPHFHTVLKALDQENDVFQRHQKIQSLQKILTFDAANVFLFQYPHLAVARADLSGLWRGSPTQAFDLTSAYFTDNQRQKNTVLSAQSTISHKSLWIAVAILFFLITAFRYHLISAPRLVKKFGQFVLASWIASLVIFVALSVLPGDPAEYMMGLQASPRALAALQTEFGLDKPAYIRYINWLTHSLHGNFGNSFSYHLPVSDLISEALNTSLPLVLTAFCLAAVTGFFFGLAIALFRFRPLRVFLLTLTRLGLSLPAFWVAVLLLYTGLHYHWPLTLENTTSFFDLLTQSAFYWPVIALALPQATWLARAFSQQLQMIEQEDFIIAARARGLSRSQALFRHAIRHALPALLPLLALSLPAMLTGSVIVENIFYLSGLGRLLLQAIAARDLVLIQAIALLVALVTLFARFVSDVLHLAIDPRLK